MGTMEGAGLGWSGAKEPGIVTARDGVTLIFNFLRTFKIFCFSRIGCCGQQRGSDGR